MNLPDIFDQGGADAAAVTVNNTYFFSLFCSVIHLLTRNVQPFQANVLQGA